MPLYEFRCRCGRKREEFFFVAEEKVLKCDQCGCTMSRQFTAPAIRIGSIAHRAPSGAVETGTEYPKPSTVPDRFENVEREIAQVIEHAPDLDGSGDCELSKLNG
jgi:putative FmdB family regulatory protein